MIAGRHEETAAVLDAYCFDPDADLLQQLLDLNLAVAERINSDEPVTAPGHRLDGAWPTRLRRPWPEHDYQPWRASTEP